MNLIAIDESKCDRAEKEIQTACQRENIKVDALRSGSRRRAVSRLRAHLAMKLVQELGLTALRTKHVRRHLLRNTIHFGAQWGWLYGLGLLPLAEVFALEFTAPIW